jgi:methyl-accepting chemotaxis protein
MMKQIKCKIIMALVGICTMMAVILGGYGIYELVQSNKEHLVEYGVLLNEQNDRMMKLQVETAVSLVQEVYNLEQKGLLNPEQARKQAADLVRDLRYDHGNYFWIDTGDGVNVVLLGRDMEGKSRFNAKDANGVMFIQEILKNGMSDGGGFTNYKFPKPNEKDATPKRSYSLLFKPYNWVVGTGTWVDHIDKLATQRGNEYKQNMQKDTFYSVVNAGCYFSCIIYRHVFE